MKKILIATGIYPPESGGPATYTKLLEERLPVLGFEVRVLPFRTVRHLPKVLRHAAYFLKCLRLARKADIIYALDTVSVGLPAALAAMLLGKKFVVRVPGDYAWEQGRLRFKIFDRIEKFQSTKYTWQVELLRMVQNFVVRNAQAVVVPSEYMKEIVRGWGVKNISVIYSSISSDLPVKLPENRPEGFFIVSTGRWVPWKGFEDLKRVVHSREKSWNVEVFENLPRDEALGWVKAADVFVINSTYEGLSHALIEAMSLGTPVIATRVGGNPELIEDGVNGLLIEAKDDESLYNALALTQADPAAARARAEAARSTLLKFSIESTISQIASLLKNI